MILVDNDPVVPTADVARSWQDQNDQSVPELEKKLTATFKQEEEQVKLGAPSMTAGTATIQIDKNVSFDVLYKIMATCAKVGYLKMDFAVMQRET